MAFPYFDIYQNKEKPLKRQIKLGLVVTLSSNACKTTRAYKKVDDSPERANTGMDIPILLDHRLGHTSGLNLLLWSKLGDMENELLIFIFF